MKHEKHSHSLIHSINYQVCPWWFCFSFDNPLRRLFQNPMRILKPYIKPGWTVLDVGPGMGYFTIPLAKLVGNFGQVIAADLQPRMLQAIQSRAEKAGVQNRIQLHQTQPDKIGVTERADFCLAFWMVHEVPDKVRLLKEIAAILKPGALFLLVEPRIHVSQQNFAETLKIAAEIGFSLIERPKIFLSNAVLLQNAL